VNTVINGDQLTLTGMVASLDGKRLIKDTVTGNATDTEVLGIQLAHKLKDQGAQEILNEIFAEIQRS
jgi:hydroxymethylbilane synthase